MDLITYTVGTYCLGFGMHIIIQYVENQYKMEYMNFQNQGLRIMYNFLFPRPHALKYLKFVLACQK